MASRQNWMLLTESGEFVSECDFVLYTGNFVCNDVLLGWNVFGEEANWVVDHDAALQAAQGTSDRGMIAGFLDQDSLTLLSFEIRTIGCGSCSNALRSIKRW